MNEEESGGMGNGEKNEDGGEKEKKKVMFDVTNEQMTGKGLQDEREFVQSKTVSGNAVRAVRVLQQRKWSKNKFKPLDLSAACDRVIHTMEMQMPTQKNESGLEEATFAINAGDEALNLSSEDQSDDALNLSSEDQSDDALVESEHSIDSWDDRIAVQNLVRELLKKDLTGERVDERLEKKDLARSRFKDAITKVRAAAKFKVNPVQAQRKREEETRRAAVRKANAEAAESREANLANQTRSQEAAKADKRSRRNKALMHAVATLELGLESAKRHQGAKMAYDPQGRLRLWNPARDPNGLQARLPPKLRKRLQARDLSLKRQWLDNFNKT